MLYGQSKCYCPECGTEDFYVTANHKGVVLGCHKCMFVLKMDLVPHPSLGKLEWTGKKTKEGNPNEG